MLTVGLAVLGILMTGCASTPTLQEIEKFGIASKSLAENTVTGINMVNDAVIERKMYLIARKSTSTATDETFQGIITEENYQVRVAAVEQLGLYANGIEKACGS